MTAETITIDKQEKRALKFPEYIHVYRGKRHDTIKLSFVWESLHAGDYYAARHDAGVERKGSPHELWDCLFVSGRLRTQFAKMQIYKRRYLFLDFSSGGLFLPSDVRDASGKVLTTIDRPYMLIDETLRLCAEFGVHLIQMPPSGGTRSGEIVARLLLCQ